MIIHDQSFVLIAAEKRQFPVWQRPNFYTSPSISRSLDAGLAISGLDKDQIDMFDFYSSVSLNNRIQKNNFR